MAVGPVNDKVTEVNGCGFTEAVGLSWFGAFWQHDVFAHNLK